MQGFTPHLAIWHRKLQPHCKHQAYLESLYHESPVVWLGDYVRVAIIGIDTEQPLALRLRAAVWASQSLGVNHWSWKKSHIQLTDEFMAWNTLSVEPSTPEKALLVKELGKLEGDECGVRNTTLGDLIQVVAYPGFNPTFSAVRTHDFRAVVPQEVRFVLAAMDRGQSLKAWKPEPPAS